MFVKLVTKVTYIFKVNVMFIKKMQIIDMQVIDKKMEVKDQNVGHGPKKVNDTK